MSKVLIVVLAIAVLLSATISSNVVSVRMDWTNYEAGNAEYECQMILAERGELEPDEIMEICQP